jgi:hypothetical protein
MEEYPGSNASASWPEAATLSSREQVFVGGLKSA